MENLSEQGLVNLYYGDQSRVSLQPCIPYGWQFWDEEVFMPSEKKVGLNCFALLKRNNECVVETSKADINSQFIPEKLENLSINLEKPTVIVLDNARIHTSQIIKKRIKGWQQRGLYHFCLTGYSSHPILLKFCGES